MTFVGDFPEPSPLRRAIEVAHQADETALVNALIEDAALDPGVRRRVAGRARRLVEAMRGEGRPVGGLDAFLHEYGLSNEEGVVLMCLAEALLRIPDADTADRLIRDKIADADWEGHLGHSESLLVNTSTWALMLTGRVIRMDAAGAPDVGQFLKRLVAKSGEPVIREALRHAMRILGRQFVMGRTIDEAIERAREAEPSGYRHSFDMLGEAALTEADAERYRDAYAGAIAAVGREGAGRGPVEGPGVSVKLSALHPRFELAQRDRVMTELVPRLRQLSEAAKAAGIGLCVDAEEADRLEISLDVFEAVAGDKALAGWDGLGLAVQAYSKRAGAVLDWLAELARGHRRRLMLRLVKGAYWDSEIKRAQEQGLDGYPVFTRKVSTDVSYLACAKKMLAATDAFFPQFATHNAQTLAAVLELAGPYPDFEFQRLHGMGEALYDHVAADPAVGEGLRCRVYAPVGSHEDLLAYLVRRLLENGSNTSFVNRIVDAAAPVEDIIADPVEKAKALGTKPHPRIPLPRALYGAGRENAGGIDLDDPARLRALATEMAAARAPARAAPTPGSDGGRERPVLDPANRRRQIGTVVEAGPADIERAAIRAAAAAAQWDAHPATDRAAVLGRAAGLLEARMAEFIALAVREGGKTLPDAVAEVREAVDFCRYYAMR
ncbi:MAG: bifunctional proline dehydrogenase/L-glutamate gamma-semialdehyde dehydrogenase PutA, partial [Rhodospirillales bacterium]